MLHTELLVDIPTSKIRIKKQNNNRYVYLIEGRKGDSKGNDKDRSTLIGKVSSIEGKMHPNDVYLQKHSDLVIEPIIATPKFDSQAKIGAVLAIKKIAEEISLMSCIKESFPDKADLILSLLTYYIITRDSAAMLYADFMFDHYGHVFDIASESTISRLFNSEMTREKIDACKSMWLAHYITANKALKKKNEKIHFYVDIDSTNINSAAKNCEMTEFGKAKVDEDLKQINFAYFYDRTTGVPIFYDSFYGSINDVAYIRKGLDIFTTKLGEKKSKLDLEFILDRGYFSEANVRHIEDNKYKFAIMGKDTTVFKELVKQYGQEVKSTKNIIDTGLNGLRVKEKGFSTKNSRTYNLYLFYDRQNDVQERIGLETKIAAAKKALEGKKKDIGGGLKRTYGNYLNIIEDKNQNILSWEVNAIELDEKMNQCGFFWIMSNMELSCAEILNAYKQRDCIEKSFRYMKSESDLTKTYAQNDTCLTAKIFMGFLVSVIRAELVDRTREIIKQKSNLSVQKILLELDKIIMIKEGKLYLQKYMLTALQQQLIKKLSVKQKDIDEMIAKTTNFLC